MKTLLIAIVAALMLSACGLSCKSVKQQACAPCPACPEAKALPFMNWQPCYYRHDVKDSNGQWLPAWVQTYCPKGCVDGDGVMKPECQ